MRNPSSVIALALLYSLSGCSQAQKAEAQFPTPSPPSGAISRKEPDASDADTSTSRCPASDFASFLRAFASDERVRDRFTASVVLVTDWRNVDEPSEGTEVTPVAKADYRDFTLRFQNGAFHNVAADGSVDPQPQDVKIVQDGSGYDVSYLYGMSEGNSWRFAAKDGCWVLSADPEPSSL